MKILSYKYRLLSNEIINVIFFLFSKEIEITLLGGEPT